MSFRRKKESGAKARQWDAFCQANWQLIERIGLPIATIETLDRFYDLLMHGYLESYNDPTEFRLWKLKPENLKLFSVLVDRYFEAGFHNPGMSPAEVGGREEYLRLARKYPDQFSSFDIAEATEQDREVQAGEA